MKMKVWLMMTCLLGLGASGALQALDTEGILRAGAINENRRRKIIQIRSLDEISVSSQKRQAQVSNADKICNGIIFFANNTIEEITIGKRNIDWRGGQRSHQEFVAQLNRFFMLENLQNAWITTGDEKYPARARELMEDYMNAVDKEPVDFVDFQWGGNLLNAALRLDNWGWALLVFRNAKSFDPAFQERALKEYARLANALNAKTKVGTSNWQIAQASALITASLRFEQLPDAKNWRKHGCEVINACFKQQFRPSGVHVENTISYHSWMLDELTNFYNLKKQWPLKELEIPDQAIRGGLDFLVLGGRFCNNDVGLRNPVPWVPNLAADGRARARKAGITDYKAPAAKIFRDAGLVYGGNEKEHFFFDAAPYSGSHAHWNRLALEYVLGDYSVILDLGITTYERLSTPDEYLVGKATSSHATVNFSNLQQLCEAATLLDAKITPEFATALGEFNAGYGIFENVRARTPKSLDAQFRRRMSWLADDYILIFDRTSTPAANQETRAVWPVLPVESFQVDGLRFTGINGKTPSVLIEMIVPAENTKLAVIAGEEKAKRPGWKAVNSLDLQKAPELTFIAPATAQPTTTVTLIAARPGGEKLPEYKVLSSKLGYLKLALPDGGIDEYVWSKDLSSFELKRLKADGTTVSYANEKGERK